MANSQTKASMKYQQKVGLVSKSFKLKKELTVEFKKACETAGVGQAETITKFMQEFIAEVNNK